MDVSRTFDLPVEDLREIVRGIFDIMGCSLAETGGELVCEKKGRVYRARFNDVGGKTAITLSAEAKKGFLDSLRKSPPFDAADELKRIWKYIELKLSETSTPLDDFVGRVLAARELRIAIPDGIVVQVKAGGIITIRGKDGVREIVAPKTLKVENGFVVFE